MAYQYLFQLDVYHSYFQKGLCSCLVFKPEIETKHLMERFGFIIKSKINGIGFYINGPQSPEQLLGDIERATGENSFCFEMISNNPDFNLFTELPPNWVGQLLYDSSDSLVLDHKVKLNQQLSVNDDTMFLGKVTLRFADILKFSDQTGFANFDIQYQARATQWQYFVINRSSVLLNAPSISGKGPIDFDGPQHVVTEAGEAALLFSSGSNLIPLSETPIHKFDLLNHPVSSDNRSLPPQIIIKGLPMPNPKWVGKVTGKTNEYLSSPMYVYL